MDAETHAAAWLERHDREELGEGDREKFQSWLAASPANKLAYLRLYAAWRDADRLSVLRGSAEEKPARRTSRSLPARIATFSIFALLLGAIASAYVLKPSDQIYATSTGGHRIVKLADGSQIELNTDTVLRTRLGKSREIWLDKGEAYFQVRHDAAHPFVVMAMGHRVEDVGTKFVVRRRADSIEITMLDGRVQLDPAQGQSHPTMLKKGDVAVASARTLTVTAKSESDLYVAVGWRRGVIAFKDTALADAVDELNRYNSRKIVIADAGVGRRTISGTIATTDVDAFVRVARNILGLHVETRGGETVISR